MASYGVAVELGHLMPADAKLTADTFPHLSHAVRMIAAQAHQDWVAYAMGQPLPNGMTVRNRTGEYARSIGTRDTGPFSSDVFTVLPYARIIEEGAPAHDMKRMLDTSYKVRRFKNGKRYLIIPFRHDRFSGLPDEVRDHFNAPGRAASHITGTYERKSGQVARDIHTRKRIMVPGWRYSWGDKLGKGDLAGMGITGAKAKNLLGIYKFANPGGAAGGGAKAGTHSQYISFRVMVEGSSGWMAKAQPGKFPARCVADQLRPVATAAFEAAMAADIAGLLTGSADT